jgi:hypothetical protein
MIKQLIKFFICKIKKHILISAGSCPFTGKSYNICARCGITVTI